MSPGSRASTSSATGPRPAPSARTARDRRPPGSCAGCCTRPASARPDSRGAAHHQLGRQDRTELLAPARVLARSVVVHGDQPDQQFRHAPAHLVRRLAHRRQRRVGGPGGRRGVQPPHGGGPPPPPARPPPPPPPPPRPPGLSPPEP